MFTVQEREWVTARLFREAGLESLADHDILDIGCGSGVELLRFVLDGASPDRLAGVDLIPDRVSAARRVLPQADIREGSAHALSFPDASFDIVSQFTVFSSILDPDLRVTVASEMRWVARPGGLIVWYDVRRLARRNPNLVAIDDHELGQLFSDCAVRAIRVTLQWGVVHHVAPRSRLAGWLLERFPPFSSHYVAIIRVPGSAAPTR